MRITSAKVSADTPCAATEADAVSAAFDVRAAAGGEVVVVVVVVFVVVINDRVEEEVSAR